MASAPSKPRKKWYTKVAFKHFLVVAFGLAVFLTDNENLTSASSFDNSSVSAKGRNKLRLPSNVAAKPTLEFDCKKSPDNIEVNTEFETIRLQAVNCGEIGWENTKFKNKLMTFPVEGKMFSSEYAYLSRGENTFLITSGKKSVKVSVFRF